MIFFEIKKQQSTINETTLFYVFIKGITQSNIMKVIFNRRCDECYSDQVMLDEAKGEIFCLECGLILEDKYFFFRLSEYLKMLNIIEAEDRKNLIGMLKRQHL